MKSRLVLSLGLSIGAVGVEPGVIRTANETGLTDWSDTYGAERRVGLNHALFNAIATTLYLISFILRLLAGPGDGIAAVILGFVGLASVFYAAYLGGDLVFAKGTGVNHTAWEAGSEDYEAVMPVESIEENKLYRVTVASVPVVLLRQGSQFYAISATCPHAGGPLDEGMLTGNVVQCPWHGSRFRMRDGRVLTGPATTSAPRYDVRVRNGQVEARRAGSHFSRCASTMPCPFSGMPTSAISRINPSSAFPSSPASCGCLPSVLRSRNDWGSRLCMPAMRCLSRTGSPSISKPTISVSRCGASGIRAH